ncbi:MAG: hypothetical protein ERJ67_02780 [Aphanocapsa feldmannii 277cV]|uniref:Uncharacterized protein n=1 Tax=Aphanocapsa feldmannii 277cV TaxID=2507553 RepID=A0A524RQX3_9CHRO|nr:MAG: hypothetical protein ERJ67_02780 [Aphanocapsa feldmannii 277cV]
MSRRAGNPLLDAATTLVGMTQRNALRNSERQFSAGEEVRLGTRLDAAARFSLLASHPGHTEAVQVELQLAPLLRDGSSGTYVSAATVALPAEGGRVELCICGEEIGIDPADEALVDLPAVCFAKALVTPSTPAGMNVGLTATMAG